MADCEKLLGGLDTPAKKQAFNKSLEKYKLDVATNPDAKFWILDLDQIQPTAYRYSSFEPTGGWANFAGVLPARSEGRYVSLDFFDNKYIVTDKLYLPLETSAPRYRFETSTASIKNSTRIPRGEGDTASVFEPITRDVPGNFIGGGTTFQGGSTQLIVDSDLPVVRVVDMDTGLQVWPQ